MSPRHSIFHAGWAAAVFAVTAVLPPLHGNSSGPWSFDASAGGLAAGASGDVTVRGIDADLSVGLDDVLNQLKGGATGFARVAYRRIALTAEVTYLDLAAHKNGVSAEMEQWLADATFSVRLFDWFTPLAGIRYNQINAKITGFPGSVSSGAQNWIDPFAGAKLELPLILGLNLAFRADVGGVDGNVTAQAFPSVDWRFGKSVSLQAGYRLIYTDYETGTGVDRFRYTVLTQGPQLTLSLHF